MDAYDFKTIGRYPPRVQSYRVGLAEEPFGYFFDGKSISTIGRRNGDSFSGLSMMSLDRKGRLRHSDQDYAQAFLASEFAYRCISIIASDIDGIPHGVRSKATKQDAPEHPLSQAIVWARRRYQQNLINLWQKSLGVYGETYIEPCKNDFGMVGGLRWLNPLAIEPYIMNGMIEYFEYTPGYGSQRFLPNELVYDKVDNLLDDLRGQSKIAVALDAINVDREIKRYTLDMLLKDMRMAGILTGRENSGLTQTDLDAAIAKLKEQKDSRLIALAPALQYQQVQQEIDGSQLQLSEDARRRIAAALGVPMSIAGAWDSATYQSAPEQKRFYYENVIFRECERHARVMNEIVLPYFDRTGLYEWHYDTDSVSALMEDKAGKVAMLNSRLNSGGMTLNEYREALGDKAVEGGDVYYVPSGVIVTPVAQIGTPSLPAPAAMAVNAVAPEPVITQPTATSAWAGLKLGALPDLIALQNRVKELLAGEDVTWNAPDDFHITLAYAPSVTDTQIEAVRAALEGVELPEMKLKVGSLRVFDNLGEYAVYFQIRRNGDLLDLQETVYDTFDGAGIATSAFSKPDAYKPHVTIGYAKRKPKTVVFEGKLTVTPLALELAKGETPVLTKSLVDADKAPDAMLDELAAWRKKVANNGAAKAATFECHHLPDTLAGYIRDELESATDKAARAIFDRAETALKANADDTIDVSAFVDLVNVWESIGLSSLVEQVANVELESDQRATD